ncbi:MAG TPA: T9SS type A sorting domain-containing protein [Ignavibacteria bacterium]|nr:T9SS type A sorting domain-containing protein [Ignavibacteria bacterium]
MTVSLLVSSPDGIYFVRVDTEKGMVSKKVVVMR